MLTRTQIQRLAQRNHISMQVQEREYIQHMLLFLLFARSQSLVFKGGTALRLVYQGSRYSEDLDFNSLVDVEVLRNLWHRIADEVARFGGQAEVRNEWESQMGYSFDVSYRGPLHDGRERSKGKVRVDINRRSEVVETRRELVTSEFDDLRPFVVTVLTPEHLLAEKIRALLVRSKPRDLFDVWLILRQGVTPDRQLLDRKLAMYDMAFGLDTLDNALTRVSRDWQRDLRPLLPQFVEYEEAVRGVEKLRTL